MISKEARVGLTEEHTTLQPKQPRRLISLENNHQYQAFDILPVPVAVIGHNPFYPLEYGNPSFHQLKQEHIGSISNVLSVPMIKTDKGPLSVLQAVEFEETRTRTIRMHLADGPSYELLVSPVHGLYGETNALVMIHDISEHESRVKQVIGKFTQERKRLAHDLKNPLTIVRGFALIAKRALEKGELKPDLAKRSLGSILEGYEACMSIIVGEIETVTPPAELRRENIAIADLLNEVRNSHSDLIKLSGTEAEVHFPPAELKIMGMARELKSLFGNVFGNAIDAMAKCENKRLTVEYEIKDGRIIFYVKDTGLGIQEENWEEIFIEGSSTKRGTDQSGTGIGLSEARRIAEEHGGNVWIVDSVTPEMLLKDPTLGQTGSIFAISLALSQKTS